MTIAITGVGLCSPLGIGAETNWERLIAGEISSEIPVPHKWKQPACRHLATYQARVQDGFGSFHQAQMLVDLSMNEALRQAGLWDGHQLVGIHADRVGSTLSASKPFLNDTNASVLPPESILNWAHRRYGWCGESRNVIAACATGSYATSLGASWIEDGLCDVVIAGSVEASLHPLLEAGFSQMGVFSTDGATRPFDRKRSGFVPGAGSGILILESSISARRRGATVLATLSGWGLGADGHSAVAFNSGGARISDVIAKARIRAHLSKENIRHVNAHGTGTRLNDRIETQALCKAFGRSAESLMISATKAGTGHLLGAAGSVEAVLTVLALRKQFVPPTATLQTPDPECSLDYTAERGHAAKLDHALSISFGFGGPIGALIFTAEGR